MEEQYNTQIRFDNLEKKVKKLEAQLDNCNFLIKLSQELNIDKTIVNEVKTYRTKAILYDRLLSATQEERIINKRELQKLETKAEFLSGLIEVMKFWVTKIKDEDMAREMKVYIDAYIDLHMSINYGFR